MISHKSYKIRELNIFSIMYYQYDIQLLLFKFNNYTSILMTPFYIFDDITLDTNLFM